MKATDYRTSAFSKKLETYRKLIIFSFFSTVLLIGILIYRDYGISADEGVSRNNALVTAKYIVNRFAPSYAKSDTSFANIPDLYQWKDKDYGVAFELPVLVLEKIFHLKDLRSIHFLHHFCIFFIFWISLIFFYLLVKERYQSWKIGLLGAGLLLLSPRIFAEAFFNSKDLVFMSLFIISTYTLVQFLKKPTWKRTFFHALACAFTIDVRIMGVILPLITIGLFSFDFLKNYKPNTSLRQAFYPQAFYIVLLTALVILFWPFLWEAPLTNFALSFKNMSKFRWDNEILYMGKLIHATNIPWHYIPVWLFITTPLVYSLFFIIGSILSLKDMVSKRLKFYSNFYEQQDVLFLALFYLPLIAVIVLHSVLYGGWRHLFFIYPAFLMLALHGLVRCYSFLREKRSKFVPVSVSCLLCISLLSTAYFMIKEHPYQNLYFSFLPAKTIEKNFDRDYWGLSFRKSIEFVMQNNKEDTVYIRVENTWVIQNSEFLKKEDQQKIQWIFEENSPLRKTDKPVYFLTEYFRHPEPYPFQKELFFQKVDGVKIASVYQEN